MIDVSIVFVSYNTAELTKQAIDLVKQSQHHLNVEIFVVDNASRDESAKMVASTFPDIKLITNTVNVGFGRANNQVLPQYQGRYVLLLNTDAFVQKDTIQKTVEFMDAHLDTGILGVKLLGRDGVLQPSCRYFPTPLNIFLNRTGLFKLLPQVQLVDDMAWDHQSVRDCDWVPGCYYLIRKEVIDQVGLFDKRYFLYYEEVDHCYATKQAGWSVTYFPDTPVIHIGGESAKTDHSISSVSRQVSALQIESELLYFRKNLGLCAVFLHVLFTLLAELILMAKQFIKTPTQLRHVFNLKGIGLFLKLTYLSKAGKRALR